MRPALLDKTNLLTPEVVALGDADATKCLLRHFSDTETQFGKLFDGTFNVSVSGRPSLQEMRGAITNSFSQAWGEGKALHEASSVIQNSFDVLCAAFGLEDGDLPSMTSMYATLIIYRYPYGGEPKYADPHYEFQRPSETGYIKSYSFADFVVSSFPFGTVAYDQQQYPFAHRKQGTAPDRIIRSPSLDWSAYSACIPHSAPQMPDSYEKAMAMLPPDTDPDLVSLCVRPDGILRVVGHAGFRPRNQNVRYNERGIGVISVGEGFKPEVQPLLFPRYARTSAA